MMHTVFKDTEWCHLVHRLRILAETLPAVPASCLLSSFIIYCEIISGHDTGNGTAGQPRARGIQHIFSTAFDEEFDYDECLEVARKILQRPDLGCVADQ